jgi:hypothetical protein
MKRIVKLTEDDLARIVRRVIKEQDDDDEGFIDHLRNNLDQLNVIRSDMRDDTLLHIEGADSRTAKQLLKNYLKVSKDKAKFIAILNCEGLDLSGIDFCQYRNLVMVNLKGTPNNFKETQGDCYHDLSHGMYDFSE